MIFCRLSSMYLSSGPKAGVKIKIRTCIRALAKVEMEAQEMTKIGAKLLLLYVRALSTSQQMQGFAIWIK